MPGDVGERGRSRSDDNESHARGELRLNLPISGCVGDLRFPRLAIGMRDNAGGGLSSHPSSPQSSTGLATSDSRFRGVSAFLLLGKARVGNSKSSSQFSVMIGMGCRPAVEPVLGRDPDATGEVDMLAQVGA